MLLVESYRKSRPPNASLPKMGRPVLAKSVVGDVIRYFHVSTISAAMCSFQQKRKANRVDFSRGIPVEIVAADGSWSRKCLMMDAAVGGAKLTVKQSIEGLDLREFFLALSATGTAFRRCEVVWSNGNEMGVRFLDHKDKPGKTPPKQTR